jgi:hypothetical protein
MDKASWQVTATTIGCDAVDDEVTLLVYEDWSVSCTGHGKYGEPDRETLKLLSERSKQLKRQLECEGLNCHRVLGYKKKLLDEEASKSQVD